jgi:hypothetical protein
MGNISDCYSIYIGITLAISVSLHSFFHRSSCGRRGKEIRTDEPKSGALKKRQRILLVGRRIKALRLDET